MGRFVRCAVVVVLGAMLGGAAPAPGGAERGPESAPAPRAAKTATRVLHLTITGDLDAQRTVREVREHMEQARVDGAHLVVIELAGRGWRADVLHGLAEVLAPAGRTYRLVCLLRGERVEGGPRGGRGERAERVVGTGHAALGLVADACYLEPGVAIAFAPGDERAAVPVEGVDPGAAEQAFRGVVWTRLQERERDVLLGAIAPRPTGNLWAVERDGRWRLVSEPPVGSGIAVVSAVKADPSAPTPVPGAPTRIAPDIAERIGLIDGVADGLPRVLSIERIGARTLTRRSVEAGVASVARRLDDDLRAIDRARQQARVEIDGVYTLRPPDGLPRQRKVGRAQTPILEHAAAMLEDLERLVTEYPELQREPPPGVTSVGQTPGTLQAAWRTAFQTRRNDLEFLLGRARGLAGK